MTNTSFTALMIRLSLGLVYMTAGFNKLAGDYIGHLIGPPEIEGFVDWEWLIMLYPVVAVIQVIVGALVLTQRYSLLGLLGLLPLSIGILTFTIVAQFKGTPILNAFLLSLLLFALWAEKDAIQKLWKRDFSAFSQSAIATLYPATRLPQIALVLILATAVMSLFYDSLLLNVLMTAAMLLLTVNLFQVRDYLWIDKLIIGLFSVIWFIVINGLHLYKIAPISVQSVFLLIPLGFLLYFSRLIIRAVQSKKHNH